MRTPQIACDSAQLLHSAHAQTGVGRDDGHDTEAHDAHQLARMLSADRCRSSSQLDHALARQCSRSQHHVTQARVVVRNACRVQLCQAAHRRAAKAGHCISNAFCHRGMAIAFRVRVAIAVHQQRFWQLHYVQHPAQVTAPPVHASISWQCQRVQFADSCMIV